jgi:hypothetical protein
MTTRVTIRKQKAAPMTAKERCEHKRLVLAAWRERKKVESDGDRRMSPGHTYHDIGPAVAEADYRPPIYGNPEEIIAAAFLAMGRRTYAAVPPLGADAAKALDELRTVLSAD